MPAPPRAAAAEAIAHEQPGMGSNRIQSFHHSAGTSAFAAKTVPFLAALTCFCRFKPCLGLTGSTSASSAQRTSEARGRRVCGWVGGSRSGRVGGAALCRRPAEDAPRAPLRCRPGRHRRRPCCSAAAVRAAPAAARARSIIRQRRRARAAGGAVASCPAGTAALQTSSCACRRSSPNRRGGAAQLYTATSSHGM